MNTQRRQKSSLHYARLSQEKIEKILMLAKTGLSLKRISANLHVPKTTIYYHAKRYCRKMTKLNLDAFSQEERGYLVGMFVGDGTHIIKTGQGVYITKFSLDKERDKDIANYMCGLFAKAGKGVGQRTERNSITIRLFSKELVRYLAQYVRRIEQQNTRRKKKLLINFEVWSKTFKLGFFSGLIDSDGHVYFDPKRGRRFGVLIRTADIDLRDQIISVLRGLDITTTTYVGKHHEKAYSLRPQHVIYIPTKELNKVSETLIAAKLKRGSSVTIS